MHRNLEHFIREMDGSSNRLSFSIVIAAVVIGSSVVMHAGMPPQALGYPVLGLAGFVTAAVLGTALGWESSAPADSKPSIEAAPARLKPRRSW